MSAIEMISSSSSTKLPAYQRLTHDDDHDQREIRSSGSVSWWKLRSSRSKVVHMRRSRRSFKLKVPSIRRLLLLRRKVKLISALLRVSCAKVARRFKEGQSHFGDLFAGNYLFLQINPSSLKYLHKAAAATNHHLASNKVA